MDPPRATRSGSVFYAQMACLFIGALVSSGLPVVRAVSSAADVMIDSRAAKRKQIASGDFVEFHAESVSGGRSVVAVQAGGESGSVVVVPRREGEFSEAAIVRISRVDDLEGVGLNGGDEVYLRAESLGGYFDISGTDETEIVKISANSTEGREGQRFIIHRDNVNDTSALFYGDVMYLEAKVTKKYLDYNEGKARARFRERGEWQRVTASQCRTIVDGDLDISGVESVPDSQSVTVSLVADESTAGRGTASESWCLSDSMTGSGEIGKRSVSDNEGRAAISRHEEGIGSESKDVTCVTHGDGVGSESAASTPRPCFKVHVGPDARLAAGSKFRAHGESVGAGSECASDGVASECVLDIKASADISTHDEEIGSESPHEARIDSEGVRSYPMDGGRASISAEVRDDSTKAAKIEARAGSQEAGREQVSGPTAYDWGPVLIGGIKESTREKITRVDLHASRSLDAIDASVANFGRQLEANTFTRNLASTYSLDVAAQVANELARNCARGVVDASRSAEAQQKVRAMFKKEREHEKRLREERGKQQRRAVELSYEWEKERTALRFQLQELERQLGALVSEHEHHRDRQVADVVHHEHENRAAQLK